MMMLIVMNVDVDDDEWPGNAINRLAHKSPNAIRKSFAPRLTLYVCVSECIWLCVCALVSAIA